MPVHNADVAVILNRIGDLLEIQDANPFRVRAYHNAARTISSLTEPVAAMIGRSEDLSKLPAIGKDLAGKIAELVNTGHLALLDELEGKTPTGLLEVMKIPGLGPKRVEALHKSLGVDSLKSLAKAVKEGRLKTVPGFGAKTQENIRKALAAMRRAAPERLRRAAAMEIAEPLLEYLGMTPGVIHSCIAGSYRRRQDTVGDLDILVTGTANCPVIDRFVGYEDVDRVLSQGKTRSSVVLRNGLQVDLRLVPEASFGAALHYFTGSKAHNIAVRAMGQDRGLKINEYGVFRGKRRIAGRTEAEVYKAVGLPYIEPELREARGELEAAAKGRLPRLVTIADIRGDLHVHTRASDGRATIQEMAKAAQARGYKYLAITDHSRRVTVAHGLDAKRLRAQMREIDRLNERLKGITIFKSVEVDILEDGSLDLPDAVLKELDFTVCAVHSGFGLSRKRQTERILRAMDNPLFSILAHPTGRLIGERPAYDVDMERLMKAARERGCIIEVNSQPERMDLNDIHCRLAKEAGVKVAISTDSHAPSQLGLIGFGVDQARRGWIGPDDVVNTCSLRELRKLLRR